MPLAKRIPRPAGGDSPLEWERYIYGLTFSRLPGEAKCYYVEIVHNQERRDFIARMVRNVYGREPVEADYHKYDYMVLDCDYHETSEVNMARRDEYVEGDLFNC